MERFWSKVDIAGPDECWLWQACTYPSGYGLFSVAGKDCAAHRVSYELATGQHPGKWWVLHSCDVRECVNPKHLRLGTRLDNMADMVNRGRSVRRYGESNPSSKLTVEAVADIRQKYSDGGISQQALADEYGVTQRAISAVVLGQTWVKTFSTASEGF